MPAEPYMGAIQWVAYDFAPRGWALCNGQLLSINQNQALFSLLGAAYGGDGRTTFALPDLRGRTPIGVGDSVALGEKTGAEEHSLTSTEMPAHTHTVGVSDARATAAVPGAPGRVLAGGTRAFVDPEAAATGKLDPAAVSSAGEGLPHTHMQPYLVLNAIIALQGIFPSPY
jgi:microcystin-dependent protein